MIVNFEFLGDEPIENYITCLNFKVNKVVFFGYEDAIDRQKSEVEKFLYKSCGVQTVTFHFLPRNNLQAMLSIMRNEVQYELSQKNQLYFDITGGESLILVAFGMLSRDFDTPILMYDIEADKLIELGGSTKHRISEEVESRVIPMTLKLMIKMHGGVINNSMHKDTKTMDNPEFSNDVKNIYLIARQNWDIWNQFSGILSRRLGTSDTEPLTVNKNAELILRAVASSSEIKTLAKLNEILDQLAEAGLILDLEYDNGRYRFKYKNKEVKNVLWEGGSILELYICHKESRKTTECQVGVHIDWDGVIPTIPGPDVVNEIDVLSLAGNIPTFISCKSGKMTRPETLFALYELETVARRFGGKYARKVLVTIAPLGDAYMRRAEELGIEVRGGMNYV